MNFTKQDIQNLAVALSKISMKDSNFPAIENISRSTEVAVIDNGKNKRISVNEFIKQITQLIDINDITIDLDDLSASGISYDKDNSIEQIITNILDILDNDVIKGVNTSEGERLQPDEDGVVTLPNVDLTGIQTQLDLLDASINPISFSFSASNNPVEYNENGSQIGVQVIGKKGNNQLTITNNQITYNITLDNEQYSTASASKTVYNRGSYVANGEVLYNGKNYTVPKLTIQVMHKIRLGFSTVDNIDNLNIESIDKTTYYKPAGWSIEKQIDSEKYLWILIDDSISSLSVTSSGFTVPMNLLGNKDGYKLYRSYNKYQAQTHKFTLS